MSEWLDENFKRRCRGSRLTRCCVAIRGRRDRSDEGRFQDLGLLSKRAFNRVRLDQGTKRPLGHVLGRQPGRNVYRILRPTGQGARRIRPGGRAGGSHDLQATYRRGSPAGHPCRAAGQPSRRIPPLWRLRRPRAVEHTRPEVVKSADDYARHDGSEGSDVGIRRCARLHQPDPGCTRGEPAVAGIHRECRPGDRRGTRRRSGTTCCPR